MSGPDDRCAREGCGSSRYTKVHTKRAVIGHAFVERSEERGLMPCQRPGCTIGIVHDHAQPDPDAAVRAIAERSFNGCLFGDAPSRAVALLKAIQEGRALGRDDGARALQAFRDGLENENSEYGRGVRDCIDAITRLEKKAQPCGHEWPCLLEDCAVRSAEAVRIVDAATRAPEKGRR